MSFLASYKIHFSPEFTPHIEGGALPPGTVTLNRSVSQLPTLFAEVASPATAPMVTAVAVTLDLVLNLELFKCYLITGLFRLNNGFLKEKNT